MDDVKFTTYEQSILRDIGLPDDYSIYLSMDPSDVDEAYHRVEGEFFFRGMSGDDINERGVAITGILNVLAAV